MNWRNLSLVTVILVHEFRFVVSELVHYAMLMARLILYESDKLILVDLSTL